MSVAQDRPVEGYIPSLSKDELAQDMLQPCDPIQQCRIATLQGAPPKKGAQFPAPSSRSPVPNPQGC